MIYYIRVTYVLIVNYVKVGGRSDSDHDDAIENITRKQKKIHGYSIIIMATEGSGPGG